MSNPEDDVLLDETSLAVLRIIGDGFRKAADESGKRYGEDLLLRILPAAVASSLSAPIAAGAVAIMGSLVSIVFKEARAADRSLDLLLLFKKAPLKTATRMVQDILSENALTEAEQALAVDRLRSALELLEQAYSYAEKDKPKRRLLIKIYQCLVAALLDGGGGIMRRLLDEFRYLANTAREQSTRWVACADRVKNRDPGVVAEALQICNVAAQMSLHTSPAGRREVAHRFLYPTEDQLQEFLRLREVGFRDKAASLEASAAEMGALCDFIEVVHERRQEMLRATKDSLALRKLWHRLEF